MKQVTWKPAGLLYRLATVYGSMDTGSATTICMYVQHIIGGFLSLVVSIVLIGVAGILPAANFVVWISVMIQTHHVVAPEWPAFVLLVYLTIAMLCYAIVYIEKRRYEAGIRRHYADLDQAERAAAGLPVIEEKHKQPSVVKLWYRSFKEKTCFIIQFDKE